MKLAEELRKAVLQAAIQGRLVEQRAAEGTSEGLYAQIQAKKAALTRQGQAKKEKPLPEITEDEIPFDIPSTWKWVRLGDISQSISDGDHQPPPQTPSGVPFIVISNLSSGTIVFSDTRHVPKSYYEKLQPSRKPSNGDILFTVTGSYGIPVLVDTESEFCFQRHIALIKYLLIDGRYLLNALSSPAIHEQCKSAATGTAQKTVGITSLKKILLPLPPLEEQKRISERLGKILPEIDSYASAEDELAILQSSFPDEMRKSILQHAMQGKLVEQRQTEGTGDDLCLAIQAERDALISAGKLKRETPLPEITDDETPFDIPDSWKWVHLNDIVAKNIKRGKSPKYTTKSSSVLVFAQKCNVKKGGINLSLCKLLDENVLGKYPEEEFMVDKDIVINSTGTGTLGRVGIYSLSDNQEGKLLVPDSHVTIVRLVEKVYSPYIFYILCNYQKYLEGKGSGSTKQKELRPDVIKALLIPIPPYDEQCRIAEKIDQVLPQLENDGGGI